MSLLHSTLSLQTKEFCFKLYFTKFKILGSILINQEEEKSGCLLSRIGYNQTIGCCRESHGRSSLLSHPLDPPPPLTSLTFPCVKDKTNQNKLKSPLSLWTAAENSSQTPSTQCATCCTDPVWTTRTNGQPRKSNSKPPPHHHHL